MNAQTPSQVFEKIGFLPRFLDEWSRKMLFSKLAQIESGQIEVVETFGQRRNQKFGVKPTDPSHLTAMVQINHPRAYTKIALGGSIGSGESYAAGDWDCNSLTQLVRIFVRNRGVLNSVDSGIGSLFSPIQKLLHHWRSNSIDGSRKNIHAHYDLGNSFFALFLGDTWMYSSASFQTPQQSLEDAQIEKLDRICKKLDLQPTDHLIEIGTGWGGFAIHAAKHYGCRITTTTISEEQFKLAKERIRQNGLEDRITVLQEDYRLLSGKFDKLASIEMIEAVGLDFLPTYFEKCDSLLKTGGRMVIQAITIRDQFYDQAKKSVDFIQHSIFPGSGIPSITAMLDATKTHTELNLVSLDDFGLDYARTLAIWADRLSQKKAEVLQLGYHENFYRLWQYYFSYCEGGFLEKSIGVAHLSFEKSNHKENI